MDLSLGFVHLVQAGVIRDTIVTITVPAPLTAFDYASGTLQILVLIVGLVALSTMALLTITLRKSIVALQGTVDRLSADVKPLITQATLVTDDVRDVVKTVRGEVNRIAEASAEVSERLLDLSDAAEVRIDEVTALLDVLQDEVQDTALSAAAAVRGARVGAVALGAALGLPKRQAKRRKKRDTMDPAEASYFDDDEGDDEDDDDVELSYLDADDEDIDEEAALRLDDDETDTDSRDERPRTSSKHRR